LITDRDHAPSSPPPDDACVTRDTDRDMTPAARTTRESRVTYTKQKPSEKPDSGRRYRYERLALPVVMGDLRFGPQDPGPGDRVPVFSLPIVGGGRFHSSDITAATPSLLVFGSITCPMTDSAAPGLKELHSRFGNRIRFVMVNVREAHPGANVPQPATLDEKLAHAERLRDLHGFAFDVAVDDLDGTLHRALSPKPNSAYVLGANRTILFRAHWANDTNTLAAALEAIAAGQAPGTSTSDGVVKPMLRMLRDLAPALDRAGSGAWADMWRVAPPLAAAALVLKTLRIRSGRE
jgi:hypothetical protein